VAPLFLLRKCNYFVTRLKKNANYRIVELDESKRLKISSINSAFVILESQKIPINLLM